MTFAVCALAAAFVAGWWWGQRPVPTPPPPVIDGFLRPLLPVMEPFELRDFDGRPFDLRALAGHWTLLTFGYTRCAEPCAPLLHAFSTLRTEVAARLPGEARIEAWFVSIDAARDAPARLRDFLHEIDPALRGATAPPEALHLLTRQLGVQVMKIGGDAPEDYWFEFPAVVLLIAPDVRPVGEFLPPFDARDVADRILRIADYLAHRNGRNRPD
ncbi:MAG: SCO family protein [Gammaproteobacteria bacterium]|nr:SCO family protein [Gammaproteobacteria bacterium]